MVEAKAHYLGTNPLNIRPFITPFVEIDWKRSGDG